MADEIKESQEMYQDAIDATREQRQQIEEDLAFSDPSDPQQWDEVVKRSRELDPGGSRPCLVMDRTGQYVDNIVGTTSNSPPSIHIIPVDSDADKKVAEKLDGLMRHIEYSSRATLHYNTALRSAARTGVGYLIVRPEHVNYELNYQEPRITSEPDPLNVVFDPWCNEIDGKNANFGYLLSEISHKEFESRFGKDREKKSFTDIERDKVNDRKESIVIAEEWKAETQEVKMIVFTNIAGDEVSLPEKEYLLECESYQIKFNVIRDYNTKVRVINWRQMSGSEVLDESEYPAAQIGIVPVYGYVGYKDGILSYCGVPRRARNPQRAYNYHQSEMLAYISSAPKSPWLVSTRAVKGLESLWDKASLESRAYLPYNDVDSDGVIAPPQRANLAINLQNHMAGAEQALKDIEASIGMYQANLGAPSNETSRVAIDGRKESGETSVSHFPLNLSASIAQVGRICIKMIPELIDTRRQQRILGIDQSSSFVNIDPEQTEPVKENDDGISINPNIGTYDARVVIGASYASQRTEAQQMLGEVMRTNPDLTPAIAPIWAMSLDIPYADKLSQAITAMSPPPIQQIMQPESNEQPSTEELMMKNQQLEQNMQEALQQIQMMQAQLADAGKQVNDKKQENILKIASEIVTKAMALPLEQQAQAAEAATQAIEPLQENNDGTLMQAVMAMLEMSQQTQAAMIAAISQPKQINLQYDDNGMVVGGTSHPSIN